MMRRRRTRKMMPRRRKKMRRKTKRRPMRRRTRKRMIQNLKLKIQFLSGTKPRIKSRRSLKTPSPNWNTRTDN